MGQYIAPLRDMQFVLHELLQVEDELKQMPKHADVDADTINQVLEEAGKFTSKVLFPLNQTGDREGCHLDKATHAVTTPKGFKEAYQQYVEAGWPSLACDPEYGGQGLPIILNNPLSEMLNSAIRPGHVPRPVARRLRMPARARHAGAEAAVPAQAGLRANGPAPCA